ncbi:hypothetical protein WJX82_011752 [Trebouxia sp. C0006]
MLLAGQEFDATEWLRFKSAQKHRNCALQGNNIAQSQRASECFRTIPFISFLDIGKFSAAELYGGIGALEAFDRHGGDRDSVDVVWVPGSFELPIMAKAMAKSGKYDGVVAIGTVVRGSTTHYEAVANAAAGGLLGAGQDSGVPVIFGVLTTENMEQALDRAGGKTGNKGGEAAVTAIEMANLLKQLRAEGKAAPAW